MLKYFYKCFTCNAEFSAVEIENKFKYLCPKCGKSEKNKPLEGVLTVNYDYEKLKKKLSKDDFLKLTPGKFWLYPYLWPLNLTTIKTEQLNKLSLPDNQYYKTVIDENDLWLMDETHNPTFSYKDRATSLVVLKAMELGINEIATASTGNAGSSLAGICKKMGLNARIFVPKNIPDEKAKQIISYGAILNIIEGDYDKAFDYCLEQSVKNNWYNRNTAYNPLTIEGKKSAAYDIFISSKGIIPDSILIPVGDGVIIAGIYKGFNELLKLGWIDKLPRLIAVQAKGSDALVRYLDTGRFDFKPAHTIADSISAGAPRNLYMATEAVKKSNGFAVSLTDNELLTTQLEFLEKAGINCELSSATVYAAYKKIIAEEKLNQLGRILLIITGNASKNVDGR